MQNEKSHQIAREPKPASRQYVYTNAHARAGQGTFLEKPGRRFPFCAAAKNLKVVNFDIDDRKFLSKKNFLISQ